MGYRTETAGDTMRLYADGESGWMGVLATYYADEGVFGVVDNPDGVMVTKDGRPHELWCDLI